MTTPIKITHEGGQMHDIEVVTAHPVTGAITGPVFRLEAGMSVTLFVHDEQGVAVRQVHPQRAVGGVGQVGVSITPHVPVDAPVDSEGGSHD